MSIKNLRDTIVPKSDQLNSEQLIAGSMTFAVTGVSRGSSAEQPISIAYAADPSRPFKPCKTMRKLLIKAWGEDGESWVGKSMTVYNDPDVKWAGESVGGIRISHLSDIPSDKIEVSLTATRGKKKLYTVLRLVDDTPAHKERLEAAAAISLEAFNAAWAETPRAVMLKLGKPWKEALVATIKPAEEAFE